MLYLVRPNSRLFWIDMPTKTVLQVAKSHGVDLAGLDWLPSERELTTDLVRLALRHGTACSTGIVVPGLVFAEESRARELRQIHDELLEARSKAYTPELEAFFEAVSPGWGESDRELNARVDEGTAGSIRDAEATRGRLLSSTVDEALIVHWRSLGGVEPDPV